MTEIDQFESVFRAAAKTVFSYEKPRFRQILVVTDLDATEAESFAARVRDFLQVLENDSTVEWKVFSQNDFRTVRELLDLTERESPDLVCAYRNLHSTAWKWPHSLGSHLDVLTQVGEPPVLVLPHPQARRELEHATQNTDSVMAITSHLVGDHRLVNYAVSFTDPGGTLHLTHIEATGEFERFLAAISKIPSIDTEMARSEIQRQLLKEPSDYIRSCRQVLEAQGLPLRVNEIVTMGRRLNDYKSLIREHEVDVLVMHTNDEDQLAMHGLAYPLAVELREIPLLML